MATTNLKTASVLAFERKLDPSDALLFSGRWTDRSPSAEWQPLTVREKSVRGTISNRLKTKDQDPAKLDAAIESPNLQKVDVVALPADADALRVSFTLRVLGGAGKPSACNSSNYQQKLLTTVQGYIQAYGFTELARRYAFNLANGRFLWRNRIGAEQVEVQIAQLIDGQAAKTWVFDALKLSLRDFNSTPEAAKGLSELSSLIADGLLGSRHVLLSVTAYLRVGAGQEVFPSQELILNDKGKNSKSKTLYSVNAIAGIHSQKVGNAIRTVDTWFPDAGELGPIAVEPYGSVTTQGKAFRQPREKADFYTLLDNWLIKDQAPATDQQHFVMATLIRGGVFGDAREGLIAMDHHVDISLLSDPEFPEHLLMSALHAKLHKALVTLGTDDIGISFPSYDETAPCLGSKLRLHGTELALRRLVMTDWLTGMRDHTRVTPIAKVPATAGNCVVRRVQVKSSSARLRRRLMKRHGIDESEASQRIPNSVEDRLRLPFVQLRSTSTEQSFRLFISQRVTAEQQVEGRFGAYGLSQSATVPWF